MNPTPPFTEVLINLLKNAYSYSDVIFLSKEYELRSFIALRPTLKRFIVIGIFLIIVGIVFQWLKILLLGVLLIWGGFSIISISILSLIFLWLSERILPPPK